MWDVIIVTSGNTHCTHSLHIPISSSIFSLDILISKVLNLYIIIAKASFTLFQCWLINAHLHLCYIIVLVIGLSKLFPGYLKYRPCGMFLTAWVWPVPVPQRSFTIHYEREISPNFNLYDPDICIKFHFSVQWDPSSTAYVHQYLTVNWTLPVPKAIWWSAAWVHWNSHEYSFMFFCSAASFVYQ